MNLYISASNRKHNSYNLLNKLRNENDIFLSLADLDIKYCIGCNTCQKNEGNQCVLKDDMKKVYDAISKCDNIIMSPIYMNQITGILKNVFDRFNPYCASENLKGKKIYLITVGQMSEEEQQEICDSIDNWFKSISEFLYFDFEYLYNFTSGDILEIDWIYVKFLDTFSWIFYFFVNISISIFFHFVKPLSLPHCILNFSWYKWYTELLTSPFTTIQI